MNLKSSFNISMDQNDKKENSTFKKKKGASEYTFGDYRETLYIKPKNSDEYQNNSPSKPVIIYSVAFVLFVISDFIFGNSYFYSSCSVSAFIQQFEFLQYIGHFCSSVLTYWTILYLIFVLPISSFGYIKTTHYLVLFFGQLWCISWLKVAYGKSRPMLQCEKVKAWSCSCDYGMPSGHSSIGAMNGYILGDFILTYLKIKYSKKENGGLEAEEVESKFRWVRILAWAMGVSVALSRIVLGVHSWNQVVYGFGLGLMILFWVNEETWRRWVLQIGLSTRSGRHVVLFIGLGCLAISAGIFNICYFKAQSREDNPEINPPMWEKCQDCDGTFKTQSLVGMSGVYMISAFVIGLYLNSLTKQRSQNLTDECSTKKLCQRIFVNAVLQTVYLFTILLSLLILSLDQDVLDKQSKMVYVTCSVLGVCAFFLVLWIIYFRPLILACCNLAIKKDFIQPNIGFKKRESLTFAESLQHQKRFETDEEEDEQ